MLRSEIGHEDRMSKLQMDGGDCYKLQESEEADKIRGRCDSKYSNQMAMTELRHKQPEVLAQLGLKVPQVCLGCKKRRERQPSMVASGWCGSQQPLCASPTAELVMDPATCLWWAAYGKLMGSYIFLVVPSVTFLACPSPHPKIYFYLCAHMWVRPHVFRYLERQKWVLDAPELELQVIVNHPAWVLGTELEFSEKAESAISPALG